MPAKEQVVGTRYGRWTVVSESNPVYRDNGKSDRTVMCKCDCGTVRRIKLKNLKYGSSKSCGCYRSDYMRKRHTTHGETDTRLFRIWDNMNSRCRNNTKWNRNYAGRGISVCEEWKGKNGFVAFKEWAIQNGYTEKLTIDRIDVNSGYSPSNCRWVNMIVQGNNRRTNRLLTYKGVTRTMSEFSRQFNISIPTLYSRLERGWTVDDALEREVKHAHNA